MYPILLCSLVGLGLVLERVWFLRFGRVLPRPLLSKVNQLLEQKNYEEALMLSQQDTSSAARLIVVALKMSGRRRSLFKEMLEEAGRREAASLNSYLGTLYLVASISPLLGLLGTVSGMINAFNSIASQSIVNPGLLAGGISEALLTTAAGLCVAIPILVAHRALASRADNLTMKLESLSTDLLEALAAPEKTRNPVPQ